MSTPESPLNIVTLFYRLLEFEPMLNGFRIFDVISRVKFAKTNYDTCGLSIFNVTAITHLEMVK